SNKLSGRAAQLTHTKRCCCRQLFWWIRAATSSLPVPVSPVMRVLVSVAAILQRYALMFCICGLSPIQWMVPEVNVLCTLRNSCEQQSEKQRWTLASSSSHEKGCLK